MCVTIFAIQLYAYMHIVDRTVGSFPLSKRLNWMGGEELPTKVAVLRSAFSSIRSGDHPEYYFDLATYWEHQLKSEAIEYQIINDQELAKGLDRSVNVLILPWAVCMSDEQRQAVREFVGRGNGVIASGATGARNADCSWRGWDFTTEITGVEDFQSVSPPPDTFVAFRGGQYYSGGLPPGLRLDLPTQEITYGFHERPDAYWSDAKVMPIDGGAPGGVALATHGEWGAGRVVWLGFNERMIGTKNGQLPRFRDSFTRSAIRWVSRQPLIMLEPWPKRSPSAVVVTADTGRDPRVATSVARMLESEYVPGTLFVAPGGSPREKTSLEVAATGDADDPFTVRNVLNQSQALTDAKTALEAGNRAWVTGFKPPQDVWSLDTLVALRTAGYRYMLDRTGNHRTVPELIEFPATTWFGSKVEVAKIPSHWSDDLDAVANYKGPTPWGEDLGDQFVKEYEVSRYLGGSYVLSISAPLLAKQENLHLTQSVLRRIKQNPVWLTTASDMTSWWSRRERVGAEAILVHQHRLRVSVVNRGRQALDDLTVHLHLPYRPNSIRLISEFIGKTTPASELLPNEDVLLLRFPRVEKESSHVFLVALDD
ncbi:MAG: hypothetical protein U0Q16_13505 [Bryobacteraceae bacterium]